MNKEWSVCYGENSKEVEVQNKRIKREKEVFYDTNLEIPANPKEPWDREMDYDDSLTPEIPIEQLPDEDDENMNMVTQESTQTEVTVSENNKLSSIGPDLELLAVLLKNPQIVFALTAGQGGSLSNAQMVKLLDAMKANAASGGSIDNLVSGLLVEPHKTKTEEKRVVEVSLPSPTPSTNPVTVRQCQLYNKKHHHVLYKSIMVYIIIDPFSPSSLPLSLFLPYNRERMLNNNSGEFV